MALSGTLNSTDYQGRYVQFSWTATQNISKNQSTITWTLKGAGKASSSYYNAGPFYANVGGTEKTSSSRVALYEGTQVLSGTKTITHGSDGKATFKVSIKAAIYKADYNCTGSKTFTLDTIPRKATITSAPNFNDEGSPKVEYSNPAGGSLQLGIYKTDGETALVAYRTVTGSSYTFNFTTAERTALQNACTTANSMSVRIYLKTTIGSNNYYHYVTKTLSIINANPVIAPTAIEDPDDNGVLNTNATGSNTRWVKGYSDIKYQFNDTCLKGATFKSCSVTCGSVSKSNDRSDVLYNVDSKDVVFTYIDSRGNKATKTISGTLVNYIKPTCALSVKAALDGETTAKFTLEISGNYFNGQVKAGVNNSLTLQYRYKVDSGSYGAWTALTPSKSGNRYSLTYAIPGLDYQKNYTFQARVQDDFYLAHSTWIASGEISASAKPVFDWGKDDFTFNVPVAFKGDKWQDLTLGSNFKNYNDVAANAPKVKRCGNVVYVCGILTPKEDFTSNGTGVEIASGIPSAWRPSVAQHAICQGSSMNRWTLSVTSSGTLTMARYGTNTLGTNCPAGAWLPFSFAYII